MSRTLNGVETLNFALLCNLIVKTQHSLLACISFSFPILSAFQQSEAVLEPVVDFPLC